MGCICDLRKNQKSYKDETKAIAGENLKKNRPLGGRIRLAEFGWPN